MIDQALGYATAGRSKANDRYRGEDRTGIEAAAAGSNPQSLQTRCDFEILLGQEARCERRALLDLAIMVMIVIFVMVTVLVAVVLPIAVVTTAIMIPIAVIAMVFVPPAMQSTVMMSITVVIPITVSIRIAVRGTVAVRGSRTTPCSAAPGRHIAVGSIRRNAVVLIDILHPSFHATDLALIVRSAVVLPARVVAVESTLVA